MIYGLYANQSSFKSVEFSPGLNIIVAEKTEKSSNKDTRNGVGKTTLINIIHFCLGSDTSKKLLPITELEQWIFTLELDVGKNKVRASRDIAKPNIIILEGLFNDWPIQPEKNNFSGELYLNNDDWKKILGYFLFDLFDVKSLKYKPSFRSLISYFARRGIEAYIDPFKYYSSQKTCDWQINIAFLLGLNWEHSSELQELRDKEKYVTALQNALKSGITKTPGELEAEKIRLETLLIEEEASLSNYKVHRRYEEIQKEANKLTFELHKITNENIIDRQKFIRYKDSIANEHPPSESNLEALYKEAGLLFSESLKHTLNEAKHFHEQLIVNRKLFLEAEITQLKNTIAKKETTIKQLSEKRSVLMEILNTHGALDEFSRLQKVHLSNKEALEKIKSKISDLSEMTEKKRELKSFKIELEKNTKRDYEQHRIYWEEFVRAFNENSEALYDEPGNLIINVTENGYKFDISIERSKSEGVGKMKVLCFDFMLLQIIAKKESHINFLIHDSTIFDGVDSRQCARALERINLLSKQQKLQYICLLNSDMIPKEDFSKDFNFNEYIRLRLTDKDAQGSLLGFKFNSFPASVLA